MLYRNHFPLHHRLRYQESEKRRVQKTGLFCSGCRIALIIFLITILAIQPGIAVESNETVDAAGKVTVTNVVVEPSVLMTGDVGLVTFTVENTGLSNVVISNAELISKDITVLNSEIYSSSRTIGAGTEMKFSFTILANQPENIYYPAFYLNYRDAGSLRYNIPIRVEEPQLSLSVSNLPDTFSKGVKSSIALHLGNAKSVNMTGITIVPSGEGIQFNQTSFFIGNLPAHSEKAVIFEITPSTPSTLGFNVSYTCGMNAHDAHFSIPIIPGEDKLAADPIINNIEISSETNGKSISGDVSNAGLTDAYGVIVSYAGEGSESDNPNFKYVIGTVESGDYASFEIIIPQNVQTVPVEIHYKDNSGNQFVKNITIDAMQINGASSMQGNTPAGFEGTGGTIPAGAPSGSTASSGTGNRGMNPMNPMSGMGRGAGGLPVTEILYGAFILAVVIGGWIIWRRKIKGKKITFSRK